MCVTTFKFWGSEVSLPPSWATPTHTAQPWHPPSECQFTCSNRVIRVCTGETSSTSTTEEEEYGDLVLHGV